MIVVITLLDDKEIRHTEVHWTGQDGLMYVFKTKRSTFRYPISTIKRVEEFNS